MFEVTCSPETGPAYYVKFKMRRVVTIMENSQIIFSNFLSLALILHDTAFVALDRDKPTELLRVVNVTVQF